VDSFDLYFQPVSDASALELNGSIYPANWTAKNLLDELPFPHTGKIDEKYGSYHLCSEKGDVSKADRQLKFLRRRSEDIVVAYCWEYTDRIMRASPRRRVTMQDLRAEMIRDRLLLKPELQK